MPYWTAAGASHRTESGHLVCRCPVLVHPTVLLSQVGAGKSTLLAALLGELEVSLPEPEGGAESLRRESSLTSPLSSVSWAEPAGGTGAVGLAGTGEGDGFPIAAVLEVC